MNFLEGNVSNRVKTYLLWIALGLGLAVLWIAVRESTNPPSYVLQNATMHKLFTVALEPVGSTMYVWGGGWNSGDNQAGASATQIGISKEWTEFAAKQDATYDFEEHLEEQEKGLDCSGYVGWMMYNLFESVDGREGYVVQSTKMAESLAARGFGTLITNPKRFLPGDIVSMQGHVWMCLGTCEDGSVLLIHSSPPGVSICGTIASESVSEEANSSQGSIAVQLAESFMREHYPQWQNRYPKRAVLSTYLEEVTLFRWSKKTLCDALEYQEMSGEEILEILDGILSNNIW